MIVMLVGLFFTVPTAVTLMVTVLGIVLIQIQVRLEEAFLLQRYGKAYREYQSHVHRWI
jgi:protein-S-isoprenylcysteine O-methyltransferase Ste14